MEEENWGGLLREQVLAAQARLNGTLSPDALALLEDQGEHETILRLRHDAGVELADLTLRAGMYDRAARHYRHRRRASQELARHLETSGDLEGASLVEEGLARDAWLFGDLSLLQRFVERVSQPPSGRALSIASLPTLLMYQVILHGRPDASPWTERLEASVARERRALGELRASDDERHVPAAWLDARRAMACYWLGAHDETLRLATRALEVLVERDADVGERHGHGSERRGWCWRLQGVIALLQGEEDADQREAARRAFERGLFESSPEPEHDGRDLVVLNVAARRALLPWDDPMTQFIGHFPWLLRTLDPHWLRTEG
ncbi:MAG: hypothetical protein AAF533_09670 [Acidobacteriota bacterium]